MSPLQAQCEGDTLILGSKPEHAGAYRRLALGAIGVAGVHVEDVAAARLLAYGPPAVAAPALVFADARHPTVGRYAALAKEVGDVLADARRAANALALSVPDPAVASALWLAGLGRAVRVLSSPVSPPPRPARPDRIVHVAVLGAVTPWRVRAARLALAAAAAVTARAGGEMSRARVHVDGSASDPDPSAGDRPPPLELGDPVHLAVFIDGGCFADLVTRLHVLRASGAAIVTSGWGAYAHAPRDGCLDIRPDMLFDSLRAVAADAWAEVP